MSKRIGKYIAITILFVLSIPVIAPYITTPTNALGPAITVLTSAWVPPSPDPSDITLLPNGNMMVVDAEVDEMGIYAGVNVYELKKDGTLVGTFDTTSFSHEPTGIAADPSGGHLFISDDDQKKIFDIDLGADGIFNTADDGIRAIDTVQYGSNDPESIALGGGYLFIADGNAKKVVSVHPGTNGIFDAPLPAGDDVVSHFYTTDLGQTDPEGVWYAAHTNTLFIVSNGNSSAATEVSLVGELVRQVDITQFQAIATAGIAYAPSSANPLEMSVYIVDRGIDNNTDSSENDGKLYELPLDEITPPDHFFPFGTVTVTADFAHNGVGSNIDTIAYWDAPEATQSLMFVSSKSNEKVEVWKYPFDELSQQTPLTHSCIAGSSNGVLVDKNTDLLYVSIPHSTNVCVFSLPDLTYQQTLAAPSGFGEEPNLALMKTPAGSNRLYVSDDDIVYKYDIDTNTYVGSFVPQTGLEAMYGDSLYQRLLIPDENGRTGVYTYDADGLPTTNNGQSVFGDSSIFNSDAEGIFTYTCPTDGSSDDGRGFIVVSDQITSSVTGNDYEVFDRKTWEYLGNIKILLSDGSYVYNTDGIASTQQSSAIFPKGLMLAINSDTQVVGVSWTKILDAAGLRCEGGGPPPPPTPTATPSPTPTPLPPGDILSLDPIADSYVRLDFPSSNYGTNSNLISSNYTSTQYAYLQYDLRGFTGETIIGAKLILTPILERTVEKTVRFTDTDWTESTLNWNNKPVHHDSIGTLPSQRVFVDVPVSIQLDASQMQTRAGSVIGLVVDNAVTASTLSFKSRETISSQPVLEITLLGGDITPTPTTTPTPTLIPTESPTPTYSPTPTPSPTATPTPTFTPTPSPTPLYTILTPIEDVHVRLQFPSKNYGSSKTLTSSNFSSSKTMLSFMKFDLTGISSVSAAELVLTPALSRVVSKTIKEVQTNTWSENTMTWNTKPAMGVAIGQIPLQNIYNLTEIRIPLDITYIQTHIGSTVSLGIDNAFDTASSFEYYAKEAGSSSPKLILY